jgi:hypothetical protein
MTVTAFAAPEGAERGRGWAVGICEIIPAVLLEEVCSDPQNDTAMLRLLPDTSHTVPARCDPGRRSFDYEPLPRPRTTRGNERGPREAG